MLDRDAMRCGGLHRPVRCQRAQAVQQLLVAGATAAHQRKPPSGAGSGQSRSNGARGQFGQGGLHIDRADLQATQLPGKPGGIEQLASRALGRRQVKIRFREHAFQQFNVGFAAGCPSPVPVEGLAAPATHPAIHQAVAGSGIESCHAPIRMQQ